jgi:hypothetical protein
VGALEFVDTGNGLDSFACEVEKAIFNLQVVRNHLTVEIRTPDTWIQKYTIVYRNKSGTSCFARLPPRRKVVQRNLSVYDRRDHRLTIIPSGLVREALRSICQTYCIRAIESAKPVEAVYINEFINSSVDFCEIFRYDGDAESIQLILASLRTCINNMRESSGISTDCIDFLKRVYFLASIYKNFYIPIVRLENPLKYDDWLLVSQSVENLNKPPTDTRSRTTMSNASLYVSGVLDLSFPLELETRASNHVRILSPPGIVFRKAGISGLEDVPHLH